MQDAHQRGGKEQGEEKEERHEGEGLKSAVENKEETSINRDQEERTHKRKRERKALREASPVCDYERIRAEKEGNVEGRGLNLVEENKSEEGEKRTNTVGNNRKSVKRALREASPACDYERIRAANIAERMNLFRTLDIEAAVAGAKGGCL